VYHQSSAIRSIKQLQQSCSSGFSKKSSKKYLRSKWNGACVDTGAQRTVIGLSQARAYCRFMGVKFKPKANNNSYRFGVDQQDSLGSMMIRVPTPNGTVMIINVDVISADVPFLIGLDVFDRFGLTLDTVKNCLSCPSANWEIPVVRKLGHVYLEWKKTDRILFTKSELIKLHRGFQHPADDKLFNVLKKARPNEADQETRDVLEQISDACNTCQRFGPAPVRFKATLPSEDEIVFGEELSIDLMFIDGKAILHIVDTATRFSAATFLDPPNAEYGQSVNGVWLAFLETWCTLYTGYPNRLRTDFGSIFTSPRWKNYTDTSGIQLRISGIEAHNSLGVGERLHAPLRRIYKKVSTEYPQVAPDIRLKLATKAMNDTMGEDGLVPSLLVFGIIPRFPIISTNLPTQQERMDALATAQKEMNAIVSERRITAALTRNIPSAADRR